MNCLRRSQLLAYSYFCNGLGPLSGLFRLRTFLGAFIPSNVLAINLLSGRNIDPGQHNREITHTHPWSEIQTWDLSVLVFQDHALRGPRDHHSPILR
jgi:hypothetical protein